MGGRSKSSQQQTSINEQLSFTGIEGPAFRVGDTGGNQTIAFLDQGAVQGALDFATDAVRDATDAVNDVSGVALDFAETNGADALSTAEAVTMEAIAASESGVGEMADLARDSGRQIGAVASDALDMAQEANRQISGIATDAMDMASDVNRNSLDFAEIINADAIGFGKDALAVVEQAVGAHAELSESATKNALAFADQATRSDEMVLGDTLVKWGTGAMALVAIAIIMRGGK